MPAFSRQSIKPRPPAQLDKVSQALRTMADIISEETLKKAGDLDIFDENGTKVKFSSLFADQQVLVVFIRHFFCGNCQVSAHVCYQANCKEYVTRLSEGIEPSELAEKNIKLFIVGCGDPNLIKTYVKDTRSKFAIYADPSQKLYSTLELRKSLNMGKKPEYIKSSFFGGIGKGIANGLKAGTKALKGGDMTQNGGEYESLETPKLILDF
jgi:peroxiredoxin